MRKLRDLVVCLCIAAVPVFVAPPPKVVKPADGISIEVGNILLEAGGAPQQDMVDRYVNDEDIPYPQLHPDGLTKLDQSAQGL